MSYPLTLWLPDGYGEGTIVYNIRHTPFLAKKRMMDGAGIFEVIEITHEEADKRIADGALTLFSEGKEVDTQ